MTEGKNNPEKQQPKVEKPSAPPDPATLAILGQFDEKEKENVDKIETLFEKRISGSKMAEIALNDVRTMKEDQKKAVHETFGRFKAQYEKQAEENKSERDFLAKQLLEEAEHEVDFRVQNIQMVLNILVKGDYITEEEAVALKRVLVGVERISVKDVRTQEILLKLQDHKTLNEDDYNRVVAMVNPLDVSSKDAKPQQRFEATTAGILIGFMTPAQRYKLVEELMDSSKREQAGPVIDGFLRSGILTVAQGEELFKLAVQKKIITEQQFSEIYQKRVDQGFYVDEVKKVRDAMATEVARLKGKYGNNIVERVGGSPLLGVGMLLHSFFWILTNVLASGGDFKTLFKSNPYIWAAIGEGALAVEITSGSMKKGTGTLGIGSGWISRALERFTEKEGPKNTVEQNAFTVMGDICVNYLDFGSYLENGGAATILKIRKAKFGQGMKGSGMMISFDELLAAETDPNQQSRLQAARKNFPQKTSEQINSMSEVLNILKIETQDDFNRKLAFIKEAQGLATGPTTLPEPPKPITVSS